MTNGPSLGTASSRAPSKYRSKDPACMGGCALVTACRPPSNVVPSKPGSGVGEAAAAVEPALPRVPFRLAVEAGCEPQAADKITSSVAAKRVDRRRFIVHFSKD